MNNKKNKAIEWTMIAYIGLSVFLPFLLRTLEPTDGVGYLFASIPTVRTLSSAGDMGEILPTYFMLMCLALPVAIGWTVFGYRSRPAPALSGQRMIASLAFFLVSAAMLMWFAFFLPPDGSYPGTKLKALLYLSANTKLGLGLIYGVIFMSIALLCALIIVFIKQIIAEK